MSYALGLHCQKCGAEYPLTKLFEGCPKCHTEKLIANLEIDYDYDRVADLLKKEDLKKPSKGIWKYKELLPVKDKRYMITLEEGNTPLIRCRRLGDEINLQNLYIKDETRNPTWSFKDRFCCVSIAKGIEFGAKVVTVSSSGNHGAATAAYAARVGIDCIVFTSSAVPESLLVLMQVYGARVVPLTTMQGRWMLMSQCVKKYDWFPASNYTMPPTGNPYGVEGYKSIGYEICDQLGWNVPDKVILPTGLADGLFGTWKGFQEFRKLGFVNKEPTMVAAEPACMAPLNNAIQKGLEYVETVPMKPTVAFSIGSTTSSYQGLKTIRDSKGITCPVTDEEIVKMQILLAHTEGLYGEPAAVASIAAAKKLSETGVIQKDEIIVCVLTSTGLKFPNITRKAIPKPPTIKPNWNEFVKLMNEEYNMVV